MFFREAEEAAAEKKNEKEMSSSTPTSALDSYNVESVKEDFSSPALPKVNTKRSPGKGDWKEVDVFEVDENGGLIFNDAPLDLPSLTPLEMSSYFGSRARYEFLDIFRQLSRQRYNFKDNKFMTFDNVIEDVENSQSNNAASRKFKTKRSMTRFSSFQSVDTIARKSLPPSQTGHIPRSPVKKLKNHFQRQMSTEDDSIEVTGEIENDVANLHLTLPKDGPAKFARPLSPRHRFILGCINSKITPRPSLLIRKDLSTVLNLEHQNMGDDGGRLLANALDGLPHLCSLNIADNNLTDEGLTSIIRKLPTCHYLTSLDISENKIDAEAAHELSAYLLSPACALIDIVMRKSDVDDNEIGFFIDAIGQSNKLINVDLSANMIGSNQRTLKEGLTMGGKVLGEMLCDSSCKLRTLKLAWNMIRYSSGVALMQSLKENRSLTYLDVSYNGLGDEGAQSFGDALQVNSTLQTILLSNNNISSSGCFCVVEGIKKCKSLVSIDLTNNPIGHRGAVSVMMALLDIGDRVKIDIRGCSIARKDTTCWFDPENPTGKHILDLAKEYDRAVAIDMLKECAHGNGTYLVDDVKYTPDPKYDSRGTQCMVLTLRKGKRYDVDEMKKMPPKVVLDFYQSECVSKQAEFLQKLDTVCEGVVNDLPLNKSHHEQFLSMVNSLNMECDDNVNHLLTKNMTSTVLFRLGLGNHDWLIGQVFSALDPHGFRCIEIDQLKEFFVVMFPNYLNMWKEAVKSGFSDCYYEFDGEPYIPNNLGTLQLQVRRVTDKVPNKTMGNVKRILTLENINNLLSSLKRTDNSYRMCEYALTNASLLFDEAFVMYKFMLNEMGEKNLVLSRLLPIMPNFYDARQLINKSLGKDIQSRVQLRQLMGPMYRLQTGNPTGFYCLHLNKPQELSCLRQLFDYSRRAKFCRLRKMHLGDTSQYGDGHGFRNAILDGVPIVITEEWFSTVPEKGKLEFDFFFVLKSPYLEAMSEMRFKRLLETVHLVPSDEDDDDHFEQLFDTAPERSHPFNSHISEADVIADFVVWCDENKSHRDTIGFPKVLLAQSSSRADISAGGVEVIKSSMSRDKFSLTPVAPSLSAPISSRIGMSRSYSNLSKVIPEPDAESVKEAIAERKRKAMLAKIWTVEYVVEAIGNCSISCDQLSILLIALGNVDDVMVFNDIQKKPYGTMKVEILIHVFNQICDPGNINRVLKLFTPHDRAALIFRIGILNVWSCLHPNGFYRLDLSKRDEKLVLKILLTLSVAGSHNEFSEIDYRANPLGKLMTAEDEVIAGQFKKLWKTERSIPDVGTIRFSFRSDANLSVEKRTAPDSLHSEMLSMLYAPPLLTARKDGNFSAQRGLEIAHSLKKASIMANNAGVKFNFDIAKKRKSVDLETEE